MGAGPTCESRRCTCSAPRRCRLRVVNTLRGCVSGGWPAAALDVGGGRRGENQEAVGAGGRADCVSDFARKAPRVEVPQIHGEPTMTRTRRLRTRCAQCRNRKNRFEWRVWGGGRGGREVSGWLSVCVCGGDGSEADPLRNTSATHHTVRGKRKGGTEQQRTNLEKELQQLASRNPSMTQNARRRSSEEDAARPLPPPSAHAGAYVLRYRRTRLRTHTHAHTHTNAQTRRSICTRTYTHIERKTATQL